ncbi:hypothetical protein JCM5296_004020, partial [Sporobolomyces johnsonii]
MLRVFTVHLTGHCHHTVVLSVLAWVFNPGNSLLSALQLYA